jgi:molybdopterin converting factor small subunit
VRVTVHVYDHIRDELKQKQLRVVLPSGATLGELFRQLAAEVHPLFGQLADDDTSLYGVNLLVLDGERLSFPRDLDRRPRDGAELHLIPPIVGGAARAAS